MAKKMDKKHCRGCYNDYYNYNADGGCWYREKAKLVWRMLIGVHERPPYKKGKKRVPDCWRGQQVTAIDPEKSLDKNGYWKY